MSQVVLYILGTIGTAVLTTVVGQLTSRFVTIGGAKPSNQAATSSAPPPVPQVANAPAPVAPARAPAVNMGAVIMQAGILQLIGNLIAFVFFFVVGVILAASRVGDTPTVTAIAEVTWFLIGTILLAIAFYVIGVRVDRAVRWRHLIYLAVGTTILTILVNALFEQTQITIYTICGSAFQAFLAMGIGGAFASRAKGRVQSQIPAVVPAAPYGYGYGAPAPGSMPLYPQPAPGSMPLYPPQSMPPYPPQPAPGSSPLYPQPGAGWNPGTGPAAPSVYPSAWPYPTAPASGQAPTYPPTPPGQQPPATQPPSEGSR